MPEMARGPARPPVDRNAKEQDARLAVWRALWEASQFLSIDKLRKLADTVISEIESDEP